MQTAIRTRFAPSPTGYMHLGNIWVAFLNWLWTRQHGGAIVLRIEDIDRQRSHAEYIEGIKEDLAWMGLSYDEGPGGSYSYGTPVQSLRFPLYQEIWIGGKKRGRSIPASAAVPVSTASPLRRMKERDCRSMTDTAAV